MPRHVRACLFESWKAECLYIVEAPYDMVANVSSIKMQAYFKRCSGGGSLMWRIRLCSQVYRVFY